MPKVHRHRRKPYHYRHRHPIIREARRIGGLALAGWVLASAILAFGFAAAAPADIPLATTTPAQQRLAGQLMFDPVFGSLFNPWFFSVSEPTTTSSTHRIPPVVAPPPTPPPPPAQVAKLSGDVAVPSGIYLPILYYHNTPADFEAQLTYLQAHGYHVITMDAAVADLQSGTLPSRAVAITFDDGFADQMNAFTILQRHAMPATFYIINGSAGSNWCIGASRRYNDPSQPPGGCGDAYLNWSQIKALDASGLITIGGHTLDHSNLVTLSAAEQFREIHDSKVEIEQQLGHGIDQFCYPYGSFNATTIEQVRLSGYIAAVSTIHGTQQTFGGRYALERIRTAFELPN